MAIELSGHYGYGRIIKAVVPSIAMMAITSVYTMVDGFFISNFVGSTAFAAINIIWPPLSIIAALGLMFGAGGSALVSKTLGEGDLKRASEVFSMVVRVTILLAILTAAVVFVFMEPLLVALGAEGEMLPQAVLYGRIVALSLPFHSVQLLFNSFYMTAERPELGTKMSMICGAANIGLDALMVVGLGWGVAGAAAATAIALSIGGIFPLLWFSSSRNKTHIRLLRVRTDWDAIMKSCTNGMSEYVGNIALNVISMCYNIQLMKYIGANGVSAYGIIMYLGFFFASVFIGYNISMSQVIAFNYGAGNTLELRSLLRKSLVLLGLSGLFLTALSEALASPLAKVFVGYDNELYDLSVHATGIYMLSFLLCGINMFVSAWFTSLNNGVISAVGAFSRTLVFELGAVLILPYFFGIDGIWNAVNVAELLAFILAVILLVSFKKRYGY